MKGLSDDFKASVAVSRQWDGKRVGQELVDKIRDDDVDPDFILLFSTIHYEGEFQKFLDILKDEFPDAPLVGGTVAGFMSQEGCYTRGVSAMVVEYENMDVAVGFGKKVRSNPEKAAQKCAEKIKEGLGDSKYENSFIVDFLSSGLVPQFPGLGRRIVIKSNLLSKITSILLKVSETFFQTGVGKQDDILKELSKNLEGYKILSGSTTDDVSQLKNFQFKNREVLKSSVVALGIKTDLNFDVKTTHGLEKTGSSFNVTKMSHGDRIISELDSKPALPEFLESIGVDERDLDEELYSKIFWFPIGLERPKKEGGMIPVVTPTILGNSFLVVFKVPESEISLLTASGNGLLEAVEKNLDSFDTVEPKIGLASSCGMRLLALGKNIYQVQRKLEDYFEDSPFLLYYVAGEGAYSPGKNLKYGNYTFNSAIFWE